MGPRRYFYKIHDMWLTCFATSKASAMDMVGDQVDEILTELQALKRAKHGDKDLADHIQSSYMCDLMCS